MSSTDPGRPPPAWLLRTITAVHLALHRISGGRLMTRAGRLEMCVVSMTGARSGRRRHVPLLHIRDGDGVLLVASQGGAETHPNWYHNLIAHPEVTIEHGRQTRDLVARELEGEEREAKWAICVEAYPSYETYSRRTDRMIPVFRCEPAR